MEDWTLLSPHLSHFGQSGLPSSDKEDDRPLLRIYPGTWEAHVEDGQGRERRAGCSTGAGCGGPILGAGRRDQDEGGSGGNQGRSWKDRLLSCGCHAKGSEADVIEDAQRQHSRTPTGRRHGVDGRGHSPAEGRTLPPMLRATPPLPLRQAATEATTLEEDPVAKFFSFSDSGRALSPPPRTDCMQLEIKNAMIEALNTPLAFEDGGPSPHSGLLQRCRKP